MASFGRILGKGVASGRGFSTQHNKLHNTQSHMRAKHQEMGQKLDDLLTDGTVSER